MIFSSFDDVIKVRHGESQIASQPASQPHAGDDNRRYLQANTFKNNEKINKNLLYMNAVWKKS